MFCIQIWDCFFFFLIRKCQWGCRLSCVQVFFEMHKNEYSWPGKLQQQSLLQSCNRTAVFLILGLLRGKFFVPALDASPVLGWAVWGAGGGQRCGGGVCSGRCSPRTLPCARARPSLRLPFCAPEKLPASPGRRDHGNKAGLASERMN